MGFIRYNIKFLYLMKPMMGETLYILFCLCANSAPLPPPQPSHQWPPVVEGQDVRLTQSLSPDAVLPPRWSGKAIKCLPKASRECVARKFAAILDAVLDKNDDTSWVHQLCFSSHCLRHPVHRQAGHQSLATAVNRQMREEIDPPPTVSPGPIMKHPHSDDQDAC